jgi:hypothetical protein
LQEAQAIEQELIDGQFAVAAIAPEQFTVEIELVERLMIFAQTLPIFERVLDQVIDGCGGGR